MHVKDECNRQGEETGLCIGELLPVRGGPVPVFGLDEVEHSQI